MQEIFFNQQGVIGFWLPLLAAFIIFVLQLLVGQPSAQRDVAPMTFNQVTQNIQQYVVINKRSGSRNRSKSRDNKDAQGFVGVLLVATYYYQKHELLVLQAMFGMAVFVFALWSMTIILAYKRRIIHGQEWLYFLGVTLLFVCAAVFMINTAQHPVNISGLASKPGFEQLQKWGIAIYKMLGIGLLFAGLTIILITLSHYICRLSIVTNDSPSRISVWVLRFTRRCAAPRKVVVAIAALFVLAYFFISGHVYYFVTSGF